MDQLQQIIEQGFERRAGITPHNADARLKEAVDTVIAQLDQGKLRVAEKIDGQWATHQWLKKAVLLSFRMEDNSFVKGGFTNYYDKVPSKFADYNSRDFREGGFRVVPPAAARKGAFIAKNVVLMPSYVNIGAYCFIGARSEVVEGVIVEDNSVISMGVFIGQSTRIYDRETGEVSYGRVPAGSVVVSGSLPSADGSYSLYCAVIVKKVDAKTLSKVGINELLRGI